MEIFDAHHHVVTSYRDDPSKWDSEQRTRVEVMDENGIDMAVVQPSHGYLQPDGIKDTMRLNDAMAEYRDKNRKRFPVAIGTVEPGHGPRSLGEVERAAQELRLNGLSWHHFLCGSYIDTPIMYSIVKKMDEVGLVPMVHIYAENALEAPWRLARMASDFPHMTFIGMDGFSSHDQGTMVLDIAKKTPNILFDTALLRVPGFVKDAVETVGSERLVFGSNQYSEPAIYRQSPRPRWSDVLDLVKNAPISEPDRANILGLNLQRAFNLVEVAA